MTPRSRQQANADAEAARQRAPITDRVNVEPAILNGMTLTETKVIGSVSFVVFMLIGALLFSVTRYWQFMLVLGTFGPAFVLWFASQYLARIKRGRPDGYYTQAIHLWLAHRGLATPKFLIYHGWWGLGRSLDLSLASAFEPPPEKFSPPPHSDRVSDVQP